MESLLLYVFVRPLAFISGLLVGQALGPMIMFVYGKRKGE